MSRSGRADDRLPLDPLLEQSADIVALVDGDGTLRYASGAMTRVLGHPPPLYGGHSLLDFIASDDHALVTATLRQVSESGGSAVPIEIRLVAADGSTQLVEAVATDVSEHDEIDGDIVVNTREVAGSRDPEDALASVRRHDLLTGLPTREQFLDEAERALRRAERQGWTTAMLSVDLDKFHRVNDRLGQRSGDAALRTVAERLRSTVRNYDLVGRQAAAVYRPGNDEFLLLCENADASEAAAIAERVVAALGAPLEIEDHTISLTASVGVAVVNAETDAGRALAEAEAATRHAKASGGACYSVSTPDRRAEAVASAGLELDLHRALEEGQFRLVYQPKLSLTTDLVGGVEALLRWDHPEIGPISPSAFIPAAERSGLIVPIGAWVVEEALRQAAVWQKSYPSPTRRMQVNVSPMQFQSGLVDLFRRVINGLESPPGQVVIEVTEGTIMSDPDSAILVLQDLVMALGLEVAVDDFGTGYSSLAYLHRLPIHEVKIDKSFIDGMGDDPEDTAIVATIVSLAHALDREVTAEGVETPDQLARLRDLGCDMVQGFLLARPMPAEEIEQLLAEEASGQRLGADPGALRADERQRRGERVLVADDAEDTRQLVRMALTSAGATVHEATSGREALARARELEPDCVILDIGMADMSGLEVCAFLRAEDQTKGCTIVMLTAQADAQDKARAFAFGADDYIVKPFAPRDLVSRVRSALRRRQGQ